jgi:hypothetical protein
VVRTLIDFGLAAIGAKFAIVLAARMTNWFSSGWASLCLTGGWKMQSKP